MQKQHVQRNVQIWRQNSFFMETAAIYLSETFLNEDHAMQQNNSVKPFIYSFIVHLHIYKKNWISFSVVLISF